MTRVKSIVYLLIFFPQVDCFAQAGWTWLNPLPTGSDLTSIYFFSRTSGMIVGHGGTVLLTTDGGIGWVSQTVTNVNCDFDDVSFVSPDIGFIVGGDNADNALILKTIDRGASWVIQHRGDYRKLFAVAFSNPDTGIAVGQYGKILRTTDNGDYWTRINVPGLGSYLNGVHFLSDSIVIAAGDIGKILRSTDAGVTWSTVLEQGVYVRHFGIAQLSSTICFVAGYIFGSGSASTQILRSTDTGITWSAIPSGVFPGYLTRIKFLDDSTGFAVGPPNLVLQTTNGGQDWMQKTPATAFAMYFFDPTNGFVVGEGGAIQSTTDGGLSWTSHTTTFSNQPFNGIAYLSASTVIVAGNTGIYKTTDSGLSWARKANYSYVNGLHFANSMTGFAVGSQGLILRTTDSGESWNVQASGTTGLLNQVYFLDVDTGIVIGNAIILRTTNSGISWSIQTDNWWGNLLGMCFTDERNGIVVGNESTLLQTTDGGVTWSGRCCLTRGCEESGIWSHFYDVAFADSNTIVYVGSRILNSGVIFRSTDRGVTWSCRSSSYSLYGIAFKDPTIGFALGGYGELLLTTDAGVNWAWQKSGTTFYFRDMVFCDSTRGMLVGANGMILQTTTGGLTEVDDTQITRLPLPIATHLSQNFPNPFNSATQIQFTLHKRQYVTLRIFDLLGRELQTLVDGPREGGIHSITWDAGRRATGIYFYRLQTETFTETKKLLLLK